MDAKSIQHLTCWGNLQQIEDVTHNLFRKWMESGTQAEKKVWASTNNLR